MSRIWLTSVLWVRMCTEPWVIQLRLSVTERKQGTGICSGVGTPGQVSYLIDWFNRNRDTDRMAAACH